MKLRNPALIRAAGLMGAGLFRLWMDTLRYRFAFPEAVHPVPPRVGRYIYAFWHESLLVAADMRTPVHTLISHHADGELIAQVCRHLRIGVVRGSPKEGGSEALLRLRRQSARTHLAVTPDGPRGPRRRVKLGTIYLASATGLPVVGFGVGYGRAWRLRSWDRFALPRPWSTAYLVVAPALAVPPGLDRAGLEGYRRLLEERMLRATEAAERWADRASGRDAPAPSGATRASA